jgi:hypothetical protein
MERKDTDDNFPEQMREMKRGKREIADKAREIYEGEMSKD